VDGRPSDRCLLALLVVIWAISWPAIKIGVTSVPPIWYACWRYAIATACLFAFVAFRRELAVPPRADRRLIVVSGVLQMAAYSALTSLALTVLPPGRASVLAFSTPIWVAPLAAWRLHERISRPGLLGVALGLAGIVAIATPSLSAGGERQAFAYAMLACAAAAWAISIVFVRSHRFAATPLALAPWQMLVATTLLLPLAFLFEGRPLPLGVGGAVSLAYVAPVATAFGYWVVVETGRRFRASTLSMWLLATPAIGVALSAVAFDEPLGTSLISGALLIGTGIRLASRS
jgi:O-acetylserine/cysteine efflux transporter